MRGKAIPQIKELITKYHPDILWFDTPSKLPLSENMAILKATPITDESYGYSKYDSSHKPVSHFIRLLANAASRGGNLLLNIGPRSDGIIDSRDTAILHGIGQWMRVNGESIYETAASPLPLQSWGVSRFKGDKLYLHVFGRPADGKLYVGGLKSAVNKAWLLAELQKCCR